MVEQEARQQNVREHRSKANANFSAHDEVEKRDGSLLLEARFVLSQAFRLNSRFERVSDISSSCTQMVRNAAVAGMRSCRRADSPLFSAMATNPQPNSASPPRTPENKTSPLRRESSQSRVKRLSIAVEKTVDKLSRSVSGSSSASSAASQPTSPGKRRVFSKSRRSRTSNLAAEPASELYLSLTSDCR